MIEPRPEAGDGAAEVPGWWRRFARRLGATFGWHLGLFFALNLALTIANIMTGRPWWAFWPLVISGFALAIHYFLHRAANIDEAWVAARTMELNLKSYDRGHIEDIKERVEKQGYGKPRD